MCASLVPDALMPGPRQHDNYAALRAREETASAASNMSQTGESQVAFESPPESENVYLLWRQPVSLPISLLHRSSVMMCCCSTVSVWSLVDISDVDH